MNSRWKAANSTHETGGRKALEDMVAAIRDQVALTNHMLQHMENNNNVAANILVVNPQFQGLVEFQRMQPQTFRGSIILQLLRIG